MVFGSVTGGGGMPVKNTGTWAYLLPTQYPFQHRWPFFLPTLADPILTPFGHFRLLSQKQSPMPMPCAPNAPYPMSQGFRQCPFSSPPTLSTTFSKGSCQRVAQVKGDPRPVWGPVRQQPFHPLGQWAAQLHFGSNDLLLGGFFPYFQPGRTISKSATHRKII